MWCMLTITWQAHYWPSCDNNLHTKCQRSGWGPVEASFATPVGQAAFLVWINLETSNLVYAQQVSLIAASETYCLLVTLFSPSRAKVVKATDSNSGDLKYYSFWGHTNNHSAVTYRMARQEQRNARSWKASFSSKRRVQTNDFTRMPY